MKVPRPMGSRRIIIPRVEKLQAAAVVLLAGEGVVGSEAVAAATVGVAAGSGPFAAVRAVALVGGHGCAAAFGHGVIQRN